MSFGIASAASTPRRADLNVTANNIANSATTGLQESVTEFAELFAGSQNGVSRHADRQRRAGRGGRAAVLAGRDPDHRQQPRSRAQRQRLLHRQQRRRDSVHARRLDFTTNTTGTVVNPQGQNLQVYAPTANGGFNTSSTINLQIPTGDSAPAATQNVDLTLNLPANAAAPADPAFDPDRPQQLQQVHHRDGLRLARRGAHRDDVFRQDGRRRTWNAYLTSTARQCGGGAGR